MNNPPRRPTLKGRSGPRKAARRGPKKLSGVTMAESAYWSSLIESGKLVRATLKTREQVEGSVEYFDSRFIRLVRDGEPNLFLYKGDILYVAEVDGD